MDPRPERPATGTGPAAIGFGITSFTRMHFLTQTFSTTADSTSPRRFRFSSGGAGWDAEAPRAGLAAGRNTVCSAHGDQGFDDAANRGDLVGQTEGGTV